MSRKKRRRPRGKKYHWRTLRCDGCSLRCRYRDFKIFDRNAYQQVVESLWREDDDPSTWRYKTRGVILGMMHQEKRLAWESALASCPHWMFGD